MRLLEPATLPPELWNPGSDVVLVPPCLATAYEAVIDSAGLRGLAGARDQEDPPVGGVTQALSDQHFAQAFDSSVSRIGLALLDPLDALGETSDMLVRCLSTGDLVLVDAPCGAGAASLSLLCCLATLREREILPRSPLNVTLVGAEIAGPARAYAEQVTRRVLDALEAQAIFVEARWMPWNALCAISTADLIRAVVVASQNVRPCCLVVANFSGFLQKERKRREAEPCIEELIRHLSRAGGAAFWIEPATNHAIRAGGLLPWVTSKLRTGWSRLFRQTGAEGAATEHLLTSARYQRVLFPAEQPRLHLAVVRSEFNTD